MKIVERVITFLSELSAWISGIFVVLMILLITVEVAGRKLFGFSTLVADEFSGYMLVLITFMGAAYTVKTEGFTRMEVIYLRVKGKGRWVLNFLIYLIALIFLLIVDYWIWTFVLSSYRAETRSISIVQTPLFIPQIFMGLGVTLLVFEIILQLSLSLLGRDRKGLREA